MLLCQTSQKLQQFDYSECQYVICPFLFHFKPQCIISDWLITTIPLLPSNWLQLFLLLANVCSQLASKREDGPLGTTADGPAHHIQGQQCGVTLRGRRACSTLQGTTAPSQESGTFQVALHIGERKQVPSRGWGKPKLTSMPLPEPPWAVTVALTPTSLCLFHVLFFSKAAGPAVDDVKRPCSALGPALGFPGSAHRKPLDLGLPNFLA